MRNATLFLLLSLGACASGRSYLPPKPGDVSLRLGAGASATRMTAERFEPFLGQNIRVEEQSSSPEVLGRAEVGTTLNGGHSLGVYADLGHADFDGIASDHVGVGLALRGYLETTGGGLRPYAEVRGGYRESWMGSTSGGGYDLGVALGVEYLTGRRTSVFAQVGYDMGSTGLDNGTDAYLGGVALMVGGSVRL